VRWEAVALHRRRNARGYGHLETRNFTTDDPEWLLGPPYKIAESVFDECDIDGCSLTQEDQG